jgi:hypothetical protein
MPRSASEGLELYDGKLSRTVLRGLEVSDAPRLPGFFLVFKTTAIFDIAIVST